MLEVITGPMFAGKTETLLDRVESFLSIPLKVQVFVSYRDDRHGVGVVRTHSARSLADLGVEARPVAAPWQLHKFLRSDTQAVLVDEGQFFGAAFVECLQGLSFAGLRVVVAGLDMDSKAQPYGIMPALLAIAQKVTRLRAACAKCKEPAEYSWRLTPSEERDRVGGKGDYEPRCQACFVHPLVSG